MPVKKTFPGEKEEMPLRPGRPEIERPGDPKMPDIPQEDPERIPQEIPPEHEPQPVDPPGGPGNFQG